MTLRAVDIVALWALFLVNFFPGFPVGRIRRKVDQILNRIIGHWLPYPFKVCWGQTIQQLLIIHQLPARWSSVRDREITPDCMLLFLIGHTLQFVHGFYKLLNRVLLSNTSHDLQCWCKLFVQVENLLRTLLLLIIWVKEEKGKTAKKENLAYLYTVHTSRALESTPPSTQLQ